MVCPSRPRFCVVSSTTWFAVILCAGLAPTENATVSAMTVSMRRVATDVTEDSTRLALLVVEVDSRPRRSMGAAIVKKQTNEERRTEQFILGRKKKAPY